MPIEEQKSHDLRWIREPFLSHGGSHGVVVVHGHTITDAPDDCGNRIGIDTGAYASGRLTALVLEGSARTYIEAVADQDGNVDAPPCALPEEGARGPVSRVLSRARYPCGPSRAGAAIHLGDGLPRAL